MFEKLWNRLSRLEVLLSLSAFGGTALTGVMSWIASTIDLIAVHGWGAVFFAGLAAACVFVLLISAGLVVWRNFHPLPARIFPTPLSPHNLPRIPLNALLDVQSTTHVASLEQNLASAQKKLTILRKEITASGDAIEDRIVTYVEYLDKKIDAAIEKQKTDFKEVERLRLDVFTLLRAQYTERLMKELDDSIATGSNLLAQADPERYPTEGAWLSDYRIWSTDVGKFWTLIRNWSSSIEDPFAPPDPDYRYPDIVPNLPIFGTHKMRNEYHMFTIANQRHLGFRKNALEFIEDEGTPPNPA